MGSSSFFFLAAIIQKELLCLKEIKDNFKKAKDALTENNFQVGLGLLESIRNKLIETDIKLEDCTNVLVHYQQAISQMDYSKYNDNKEEVSNDEEQ